MCYSMFMATLRYKNKLTHAVRKQVAAAFRELLSDPDAGSVLRPAFESRLRKSVRSAEAGRVKDFSEIFKRYRV